MKEIKIITDITRKTIKRRKKIFIYSGNELLKETTYDVILKLGIKKGIEWTEELNERVDRLESLFNATRTAANKLFIRPRTVKELKDTLSIKNYDYDIINEVIEDFTERGHLNDEDFSQKYICHCLKVKDWGPNKIKAEMIKKGISQNIIQKAINKSEEKESQIPKIIKLISKKSRFMKNEDPDIIKKKLLSYLIGKGFETDLILKILDETDLNSEE